ncbi:MAG: hypothetical protein IJ568_01230 [Bacilli bacterium]|nr:hypothetical protein [Bacilli bacterium]
MIEVIITIFIVYLIYFFVSVQRFDKNGHFKNKKKEKISDYEALPSEVKYFIKKYNVDLEKINLRALLKIIGIILGLDIGILSILSILLIKNNVVLEILVASILIIPLYLISLKFLGNYFKKKGLIKNE